MSSHVLVVDDEESIRDSCAQLLSKEGCTAGTAANGYDALKMLKEEVFDVILLDLKMPGPGGMEVLKHIREADREAIVVVITGYATVESAVEAMKLGAYDFIRKPFTPDELRAILRRALERRRLILQNRFFREELEVRYRGNRLIGACDKMREVYAIIERVAPTDSTVLIYGESGTGKELVARAIHYNSLRKNEPFLSIDCGALSETLLESELFGHVKGSFTGAIVTKPALFEVANGGTLFLDEVGNMSVGLQSKLLRVLEEKEFKKVGGTTTIRVDVRIIAATNKDLENMVAEGGFREDLYYRLNIVPIPLPPLREREGDIPLLAHHFLNKYNKERNKKIGGFSPEAISLLMNHEWPGNVRELENVIERTVIMTDDDIIGPRHLPQHLQKEVVLTETSTPANAQQLKQLKRLLRKQAVRDAERLFTIEALKRNNWNITRAAEETGMKRQNFQALVKKYGITVRR